MTSLARKIRRKKFGAKRFNELYPRPPEQARIHKDGLGYDALHPTKGWKRHRVKRRYAQFRMAQLLGG